MYTRQWHAALVAVVLAGSWAIWAPHPSVGQEAESGAGVPEAVTTEGAEYCAHLQQKYAQIERAGKPAAAAEAATLSNEGARMCGRGNTRAGILRLRRALVLIMNPPRP
jgi:hypothetical protein